VEGAELSLSISADGNVVYGSGKPLGGLEGIPTEARVPESVALERARQRAAAACSLHEPLTFAKTVPPALLISDRHARLVWQVMVLVLEPKWVEWAVQIDATTGEVLREWGGMGINGTLPGCSPSA